MMTTTTTAGDRLNQFQAEFSWLELLGHQLHPQPSPHNATTNDPDKTNRETFPVWQLEREGNAPQLWRTLY
jgi:hypothetical protein